MRHAQPTPLHDVHRERGASFGEIDGWQVPLHYGDPAAEYRAMREGAAVIDRSMLGKVTVTGRDRQAFLQGMLTNDVKGLTPGKGTGAAFLDALGKVVVLLNVYALDDRLLIELPPSFTEKTLERLDHFLISEKVYFEAADSAFAIIAVQGPAAGDLLVEARGANARSGSVRARGSGHRGRARARDPSARGRRRGLSLLDRGGSRRGALGRHR
jgi:glycine cleavage system aminomethyltransferase T